MLKGAQVLEKVFGKKQDAEIRKRRRKHLKEHIKTPDEPSVKDLTVNEKDEYGT